LYDRRCISETERLVGAGGLGFDKGWIIIHSEWFQENIKAMNSTNHNPPTNEDETDKPVGDQLDSPEAIESFARTYFASDFPNSQRAGCPPRLKLIEAARAARLPGDDLRAHLLACSECFNDFREARQTPATAKITPLRQRFASALTSTRAAAIAAAALLILLSIVAVIVLRNHSRTATDSTIENGTGPSDDSSRVANRAPIIPRTNEDAVGVITNANRPSLTSANRPIAQVAVRTAKIQLDDYPVLRGTSGQSGQENKTIVLTRSRYKLLLTLPEGSEKGTYRVSIADEFGRVKVRATSPSADGRQLRVVLDLNRLPQKTYRLCIGHHAHAGDEEPPRCYKLRMSDAENIAPPR
jgi:hypothetical protein